MNHRAPQEPTTLLLTALAGAPRHGYALITEVAEISGGRVELRAGTLYGAFALTEPGRGVLAAEAERFQTTALGGEHRPASDFSHASHINMSIHHSHEGTSFKDLPTEH